jgi:hypothetical protein
MRFKWKVMALFTALMFNATASLAVAAATGWSPPAVFGVMSVVSCLPLTPAGSLAAGLKYEIWLPESVEKFYPDSGLLSYGKNLDAWVDNNTINLQEAGVDPGVLVNNTTYPIPISSRTDVPHALPLMRLDTENTVYRDAVEVEESAGKRQSVIEGHRNALRLKLLQLAAHGWAPAGATAKTPIVTTVDEAPTNTEGYNALRFEDILAMKLKFDTLEIPADERVLALSPMHEGDLILADIKLYKSIWDENRLFTFKIVRCSQTPYYTSALAKKAFGAAIVATDLPSSLAFHDGSVARCIGTFDMYSRLKDPEYRGDIIGFNVRALALPVTGKHIGAIVSKKPTPPAG